MGSQNAWLPVPWSPVGATVFDDNICQNLAATVSSSYRKSDAVFGGDDNPGCVVLSR